VAALPSIGRATRVERPVTPGADAAGALYERYSAQILGFCLHQLGSREEAEDAVQTTFMNAFRGLQRGIVPELESAWLFKIAHNVCLSRRRSSWRRGKVEAPNNFEVLQEVIPGREQVADELIRLQDVLEDMPETQRRAILLREWQGLTYREISTELGLSQAAVETLIFRARRALAQGLEQDADTWKRRLRRGADAGGAVACITALSAPK
jgi:RNA polymerase sigma factor (sigma-70 family)